MSDNNITKIKARKLKKIQNKIEELNKESISNKENKEDKSKKIKMSFTKKEEQILDKKIELEDNISIVAMIGILIFCFVIGISLGYILYRIAINSSNAMVLIRYFLK